MKLPQLIELLDWDRLFDAIRAIPDIVRQPTTNPAQSWAVFGIFTLLMMIVLVVVILWMSGSNEDDDEYEDEEFEDAAGSASADEAHEPVPEEPKRPLGRRMLSGFAWLLFVVAAVWIATGVSTGSRAACESCHTATPHGQSAKTDAHASVSCVSCHEPGSGVEKATVNLPARVTHFLSGRGVPSQRLDDEGVERQTRSNSAGVYGTPISSAGCTKCHRERIADVVENKVQGIRVSHTQPLAAGAECVDCHEPEAGEVSARTVGMAPCLRCHNGTAASEKCSTCHVGDPAQAIRAERPAENTLARRQVPLAKCDSCHKPKEEGCDSCHGIRLPHTQDFMRYGHAREGALDLWTNGGRTCGKCHNKDSRSCNNCHGQFYAHGADWMKIHGKGVSFRSGCACHDQKAYEQGRQFCTICHTARPPGAKP